MVGRSHAHWLALLIAAIGCGHACTATSATEAAAADEELLVTGERPGPRLWKLSRNGHVLWILGTLTPLPKDMHWRSRDIETTLASSAELIETETVNPKYNLFRTLRYLPAIRRTRYDAEGRKLSQVVPAELYARWQTLKRRYIGADEDIERMRPMFAAITLYRRALTRSGLTSEDAVTDAIRRLAKKRDLTITKPTVDMDLRDPKRMLQDFSQTSRESEMACFAATLQVLETEVDNMKQRAIAWADGDIEALARLPAPPQREVCVEAFTSAPGIREQFAAVTGAARKEWLRRARAALERHTESIALLPIRELLDPNGRLAELKAEGYVLEPPR